jgi:hypothetical protein
MAARGINCFYAVYDGSGKALDVSVLANSSTQTIRIGFDDANPASAPVDAAASSIVLAPASIRADNLQSASVTIVPRDRNGELLGRGLAVAIDASLLWPGHLSGAIADLGDGTYLAHVAASVPGTGSVRVIVEGVSLAAIPTITAVAVDPATSLRDLAIAELQSLSGPGGPMTTLAAQAGHGTSQENDLNAAIAGANAALATLANDDFDRDDNVLKTDLDGVLYKLAHVLASPGALAPMDVRDTMDDLLGIARLIAEWHLDRAAATCGVCNGKGKPNKVCDASAAIAAADAMRAAISPDWSSIIDEYAWAVELSLQAVQSC